MLPNYRCMARFSNLDLYNPAGVSYDFLHMDVRTFVEQTRKTEETFLTMLFDK